MARCCADLYELPIVEYLLGNSFHPGGPKLTRELASATLISPDSKVLDVACGTGTSARVIADSFGASVTGCDYSAVNLDRARHAASAAGLSDRTRFVRAAAERLPFAPGRFDVAICECSLCLFENKASALEQINRALRPGGRIGISDFFLNNTVPESLEGLLGRVLCITGALSKDNYRALLERAGFKFVRIRETNWALLEMSKRVRRRLHTLESATAFGDIPSDWGDPSQVLRDFEQFIVSGGAGYMLATGRRI